MTTPITLFTCPKAFTGDFERIQTNAIRSWKALDVEEIILLGDDAGVEAFCQREQVTWGGLVARNAYGTPLLHEVFELGEQIAHTEVVCYLNADILLFDDFVSAIDACANALAHFMMSGQRFDTDWLLDNLEDWSSASFRMAARITPERYGSLHGDAALDYFAYRKGDLGDIPPFAIGRFRSDNWLAWRALSRGLAFVDATEAVFVAHQNHGYSHAPGEVERFGNDVLVGTGGGELKRLRDATHILRAGFQLMEKKRA